MRRILLIVLFAAAVTGAAAYLMRPGGYFGKKSQSTDGTASPTSVQGNMGIWEETKATLRKVADTAEKASREAARQGQEALKKARKELRNGNDTPPASNTSEAQRKGPTGEKGTGESLTSIRLPKPVRKARFAMTPYQIKERFEISWRRRKGDELMLVHRLKPNAMARFHFTTGNGLQRVEIRFRRTDPDENAELYRRIRSHYHERYGDLPESGRTHWADGNTRVRIDRGEDAVQLIFVPRR
jgi:hypothetical protein